MLNYSKNNVYFCRMKFEDIHNVHEKLHEENASPEALEERCDGAVLHRWRYKMNVQRHLSICQVCFAWCAKVPCQLSEAHCTCAKAPCRLSEAHCTCAKAPCRLSEAHCKLLVSAKSLADSQTALFVTLPYGESSISA